VKYKTFDEVLRYDRPDRLFRKDTLMDGGAVLTEFSYLKFGEVIAEADVDEAIIETAARDLKIPIVAGQVERYDQTGAIYEVFRAQGLERQRQGDYDFWMWAVRPLTERANIKHFSRAGEFVIDVASGWKHHLVLNTTTYENRNLQETLKRLGVNRGDQTNVLAWFNIVTSGLQPGQLREVPQPIAGYLH